MSYDLEPLVIDTNVFIEDPKIILKLKNRKIILPMVVLQELDNLKTGRGNKSFRARKAIKILENEFQTGKVQIEALSVSIFIDSRNLEIEIDSTHPGTQVNDDIILDSCVRDGALILSNDLNMRIKAISKGFEALTPESFKSDVGLDYLYSGFSEHYVDSDVIDSLFSSVRGFSADIDIPEAEEGEFLVLKDYEGGKSALARKSGDIADLCRTKFKEYEKMGISFGSKEQLFAINALLDPETEVVSLVGKAGTGKTFLALLAALTQTSLSNNLSLAGSMFDFKAQEGQIYEKIVITTPIVPIGEDLGYLPGSIKEKFAPWISGIKDNIRQLTKLDDVFLEEFMNNFIDIQPATYIRGRTISNTFFIVDEAQNFSREEIKTIMTRVGENTKVVLTGDVEQIDVMSNTFMNNGLTHVIECFRSLDFFSHVTFKNCERSRVADFAGKLL